MLYQSCWNNLVTGLIVPSSLLQFVNSLFQTCSNKFGTSSANTSCRQLVNRLVTTCLQVCSNLCVFTCVVETIFRTSCKQLVTSLVGLSNLSQGCSNKTDQSWYNNIVTYSLVLSTLWQSCYNRPVSELLGQPWSKSDIPVELFVVLNLLTTWNKQCEDNLLTACWQICCKLRYLRV